MTYDVIIVGGGIVGLATAYRLQQRQPHWKVLLLEKEAGVARHQTGNNSGVIHSGIYYKPGSLKARLCVEGGSQLVDLCRRHDIPHRITGKLIVATREDELARMEDIRQRGLANGIKGLRVVDGPEMRAIEPHVQGIRAIVVPTTGIVDYVRVCEVLVNEIETAGGRVVLRQNVASIEERASGEIVVTTNHAEHIGRRVVTCGGLQSDRLAALTDRNLDFRILPFRGEYYTVRPERVEMVKGLIYPVPDARFPFLGVHFTRMVDGGLEVGPNAVLAFKREGYAKTDISGRDLWETFTWPGFHAVARKYWRMGVGEFHRSFSKRAFVTALQRLVPDITEDDLAPGGAGVRAQACDRVGGLIDDFHLVEHGKVIHVCNAPSPAATASLAIGGWIADRVCGT